MTEEKKAQHEKIFSEIASEHFKGWDTDDSAIEDKMKTFKENIICKHNTGCESRDFKSPNIINVPKLQFQCLNVNNFEEAYLRLLFSDLTKTPVTCICKRLNNVLNSLRSSNQMLGEFSDILIPSTIYHLRHDLCFTAALNDLGLPFSNEKKLSEIFVGHTDSKMTPDYVLLRNGTYHIIEYSVTSSEFRANENKGINESGKYYSVINQLKELGYNICFYRWFLILDGNSNHDYKTSKTDLAAALGINKPMNADSEIKIASIINAIASSFKTETVDYMEMIDRWDRRIEVDLILENLRDPSNAKVGDQQFISEVDDGDTEMISELIINKKSDIMGIINRNTNYVIKYIEGSESCQFTESDLGLKGEDIITALIDNKLENLVTNVDYYLKDGSKRHPKMCVKNISEVKPYCKVGLGLEFADIACDCIVPNSTMDWADDETDVEEEEIVASIVPDWRNFITDEGKRLLCRISKLRQVTDKFNNIDVIKTNKILDNRILNSTGSKFVNSFSDNKGEVTAKDVLIISEKLSKENQNNRCPKSTLMVHACIHPCDTKDYRPDVALLKSFLSSIKLEVNSSGLRKVMEKFITIRDKMFSGNVESMDQERLEVSQRMVEVKRLLRQIMINSFKSLGLKSTLHEEFQKHNGSIELLVEDLINNEGLESHCKDQIKESYSIFKGIKNKLSELGRLKRVRKDRSFRLKLNDFDKGSMKNFGDTLDRDGNPIPYNLRGCQYSNKTFDSAKEELENIMSFFSMPVESGPDINEINTMVLDKKLRAIESVGTLKWSRCRFNQICDFMHDLSNTLTISSCKSMTPNDYYLDNLGRKGVILIIQGGKSLKTTGFSRMFKLCYPSDEVFKGSYSSRFIWRRINDQVYIETPWMNYNKSLLDHWHNLKNQFDCAYASWILNSQTGTVSTIQKLKMLLAANSRRCNEIMVNDFRYIVMNLYNDYNKCTSILSEKICVQLTDKVTLLLAGSLLSNYFELSKKSKMGIFCLWYNLEEIERKDLGNTIFINNMMAIAAVTPKTELLKDIKAVLDEHVSIKSDLNLDYDNFCTEYYKKTLLSTDEIWDSMSDNNYVNSKVDIDYSCLIGKTLASSLRAHKGRIADIWNSVLKKPYTCISNTAGLRTDQPEIKGYLGKKGSDVVFSEFAEHHTTIIDYLSALASSYGEKLGSYKSSRLYTQKNVTFSDIIISPLSKIGQGYYITYKIQKGGSREIYVMHITTKIRQYPLEQFFGKVCSLIPNELISVSSDKRRGLIHSSLFENIDRHSDHYYGVMDCRRWGPRSNFAKYIYMILNMKDVLPNTFIEDFLDFFNSSFTKRTYFNRQVFELIPEGERINQYGFVKNFGDDICGFDHPYSFMMGIFNYLSSLYHAGHQIWVMNYVDNNLKCNIKMFCHSDDSAALINMENKHKSQVKQILFEQSRKEKNIKLKSPAAVSSDGGNQEENSGMSDSESFNLLLYENPSSIPWFEKMNQTNKNKILSYYKTKNSNDVKFQQLIRMLELTSAACNCEYSAKKISFGSIYFEFLSILYFNNEMSDVRCKFLERCKLDISGSGFLKDYESILAKEQELIRNGCTYSESVLCRLISTYNLYLYNGIDLKCDKTMQLVKKAPFGLGGMVFSHPMWRLSAGNLSEFAIYKAVGDPKLKTFLKLNGNFLDPEEDSLSGPITFNERIRYSIKFPKAPFKEAMPYLAGRFKRHSIGMYLSFLKQCENLKYQAALENADKTLMRYRSKISSKLNNYKLKEHGLCYTLFDLISMSAEITTKIESGEMEISTESVITSYVNTFYDKMTEFIVIQMKEPGPVNPEFRLTDCHLKMKPLTYNYNISRRVATDLLSITDYLMDRESIFNFMSPKIVKDEVAAKYTASLLKKYGFSDRDTNTVDSICYKLTKDNNRTVNILGRKSGGRYMNNLIDLVLLSSTNNFENKEVRGVTFRLGGRDLFFKELDLGIQSGPSPNVLRDAHRWLSRRFKSESLKGEIDLASIFDNDRLNSDDILCLNDLSKVYECLRNNEELYIKELSHVYYYNYSEIHHRGLRKTRLIIRIKVQSSYMTCISLDSIVENIYIKSDDNLPELINFAMLVLDSLNINMSGLIVSEGSMKKKYDSELVIGYNPIADRWGWWKGRETINLIRNCSELAIEDIDEFLYTKLDVSFMDGVYFRVSRSKNTGQRIYLYPPDLLMFNYDDSSSMINDEIQRPEEDFDTMYASSYDLIHGKYKSKFDTEIQHNRTKIKVSDSEVIMLPSTDHSKFYKYLNSVTEQKIKNNPLLMLDIGKSKLKELAKFYRPDQSNELECQKMTDYHSLCYGKLSVSEFVDRWGSSGLSSIVISTADPLELRIRRLTNRPITSEIDQDTIDLFKQFGLSREVVCRATSLFSKLSDTNRQWSKTLNYGDDTGSRQHCLFLEAIYNSTPFEKKEFLKTVSELSQCKNQWSQLSELLSFRLLSCYINSYKFELYITRRQDDEGDHFASGNRNLRVSVKRSFISCLNLMSLQESSDKKDDKRGTLKMSRYPPISLEESKEADIVEDHWCPYDSWLRPFLHNRFHDIDEDELCDHTESMIDLIRLFTVYRVKDFNSAMDAINRLQSEEFDSLIDESVIDSILSEDFTEFCENNGIIMRLFEQPDELLRRNSSRIIKSAVDKIKTIMGGSKLMSYKLYKKVEKLQKIASVVCIKGILNVNNDDYKFLVRISNGLSAVEKSKPTPFNNDDAYNQFLIEFDVAKLSENPTDYTIANHHMELDKTYASLKIISDPTFRSRNFSITTDPDTYGKWLGLGLNIIFVNDYHIRCPWMDTFTALCKTPDELAKYKKRVSEQEKGLKGENFIQINATIPMAFRITADEKTAINYMQILRKFKCETVKVFHKLNFKKYKMGLEDKDSLQFDEYSEEETIKDENTEENHKQEMISDMYTILKKIESDLYGEPEDARKMGNNEMLKKSIEILERFGLPGDNRVQRAISRYRDQMVLSRKEMAHAIAEAVRLAVQPKQSFVRKQVSTGDRTAIETAKEYKFWRTELGPMRSFLPRGMMENILTSSAFVSTTTANSLRECINYTSANRSKISSEDKAKLFLMINIYNCCVIVPDSKMDNVTPYFSEHILDKINTLIAEEKASETQDISHLLMD